MTQEEKQLLLKDLCARLPYGVIINSPSNIFYPANREDVKLDSVFEIDGNFHATEDSGWPIEECKPYLRPMESMTEEEKVEYNIIKCSICPDEADDYAGFVDWLNKKMFDYRGLIPMGLALPATEGMYNKKEE